MRIFTELLAWVVLGQIALCLAFQFEAEKARALYAMLEFSPVYGGFLLLAVALGVWLALQLMRSMALKGVGSKSRRQAKSKGYGK
jgi:hypothetical protein